MIALINKFFGKLSLGGVLYPLLPPTLPPLCASLVSHNRILSEDNLRFFFFVFFLRFFSPTLFELTFISLYVVGKPTLPMLFAFSVSSFSPFLSFFLYHKLYFWDLIRWGHFFGKFTLRGQTLR